MATEVFQIDSYEYTESDAFFIDTNIWLYINAPQPPGDWKTRIYSKALAKILSAKSQIYIDALVISEYINRYARLAHELSKASITFKEFRQSPAFKSAAKDIEISVKGILKHCQKTEIGFPSCDINQLLSKFGEGNSDFNDQLMIELCKSKGFKLITHDQDFKECGLTVLTANKRLLS